MILSEPDDLPVERLARAAGLSWQEVLRRIGINAEWDDFAMARLEPSDRGAGFRVSSAPTRWRDVEQFLKSYEDPNNPDLYLDIYLKILDCLADEAGRRIAVRETNRASAHMRARDPRHLRRLGRRLRREHPQLSARAIAKQHAHVCGIPEHTLRKFIPPKKVDR